MEYMHVTHEAFGPCFDERSRILILGSVPSVKSRQAAFYYGHPKNRFWLLLYMLCQKKSPEDLPKVTWAKDAEEEADLRQHFPEFPWSKEEKEAFLHRYGIACWDTIDSCDIKGSSDASIRNVTASDIPWLLEQAPIEKILCNGASSYQCFEKYVSPKLEEFYKRYPERNKVSLRKLPSTSPANAASTLIRLAEVWGEAVSIISKEDRK